MNGVVENLSENSNGMATEKEREAEFGFSVVPLQSARHRCLRTGERDRVDEPQLKALKGFALITRGSGKVIVDADSHAIAPGTVLFLRPNQRVMFEATGQIDGFEVLFSEGFLTLNEVHAHRLPGADLFQEKKRTAVYHLSEQDAERALNLILDIRMELDLRFPAYATALRSFLIVLLLHFWRCLGLSGQGNEERGLGRNNLVRRFEKLVVEEPRLDRTVTHYAEQLEVSASHLLELVKETTGLTPIAVIQREVILEAKRLLIHTDLQVADIAEKLAFKDASYFGRYFRRNTMSTPGEYRRISRQSLGLVRN